MANDPIGGVRLFLVAIVFVGAICGAGIYAGGQGEQVIQVITGWLGL